MDYTTSLEEMIMKIKGMETVERHLSLSEGFPDGDRCMHLNMARELKGIREELKEILEALMAEGK